MCSFLETVFPMWLGCLPAQAEARLACPCFKWPALGPGSTSISISASRLYSQKYFRQKLQTNVSYKYNPRLFYYIDLNWRLSAIVVNPHQEWLANTLGYYCYFLNMFFFDALASLDFKLSVAQSVIFFLQLAHLRVFQIFFFLFCRYFLYFVFCNKKPPISGQVDRVPWWWSDARRAWWARRWGGGGAFEERFEFF